MPLLFSLLLPDTEVLHFPLSLPCVIIIPTTDCFSVAEGAKSSDSPLIISYPFIRDKNIGFDVTEDEETPNLLLVISYPCNSIDDSIDSNVETKTTVHIQLVVVKAF